MHNKQWPFWFEPSSSNKHLGFAHTCSSELCLALVRLWGSLHLRIGLHSHTPQHLRRTTPRSRDHRHWLFAQRARAQGKSWRRKSLLMQRGGKDRSSTQTMRVHAKLICEKRFLLHFGNWHKKRSEEKGKKKKKRFKLPTLSLSSFTGR